MENVLEAGEQDVEAAEPAQTKLQAEPEDDGLGSAAKRIAAQLAKKRQEPPREATDEEIRSVAERIAGTVSVYTPTPFEKAAIGASEGLAALAEAPEIAAKALERVIPPHVLYMLGPNARLGAAKLAAVGRDIQNAARQAAPPEFRETSIAGQLPYVAGQAAPLMAAGGLGAAAAGAVGAAQTAVPMYHEVLAATGDEDAAMVGALLGLGIGATEAMGVGPIFSKLNRASGGGVTRFLTSLATESLEEGAQEVLQQSLQDAAITSLTPAEMDALDRLESAGKAGALGLVFGAFAGAGVHGAHQVGGAAINAARGPKGVAESDAPTAQPSAPGGKSIEDVSFAAQEQAGAAGTSEPAASGTEPVAPAVQQEPSAEDEEVRRAADDFVRRAHEAVLEEHEKDRFSEAVFELERQRKTSPKKVVREFFDGPAYENLSAEDKAELTAALNKKWGPDPEKTDKERMLDFAQGVATKFEAMREDFPETFELFMRMARLSEQAKAAPASGQREAVALLQEPSGEAERQPSAGEMTPAQGVPETAPPEETKTERRKGGEAPEGGGKRTADLVASIRELSASLEPDASEEVEDEMPAALQRAERVLENRRAAGITPSELDATLEDLLHTIRVPPQEIGSKKEEAAAAYADATQKKAKAVLDVFDAAKAAATKKPDHVADAGKKVDEPLVYAHGEDVDEATIPSGAKLGPVEPVPIADLQLKQIERFRSGVDEERVEKLMVAMTEGQKLPPVVAVRAPDGKLVLVDGHHRVVAADRAGFDSVPVRIVEPKAARPLSPEDEASDRILRGEHLSLEEMQATPGAIRKAAGRAQRGEKPRPKPETKKPKRETKAAEAAPKAPPAETKAPQPTPPAPQREPIPPTAQAVPTEAVEESLGTAEGVGGSPAPKPTPETSLREFIRSIGGIAFTADAENFTRKEQGETRIVSRVDKRSGKRVEARMPTRAKPIVHARGVNKGLPIDDAAEAAWEAGFFAERPTINELLDALEADKQHPGAPVNQPSEAEQQQARASGDLMQAALDLENLGKIEFSAFPGGLLDPLVREARKLIGRLRRTPPLQEGAATIPTASWTQRAVQKYADYFSPVQRVERALAGERRPGEANLPDESDAYLQETLRRGVTKRELEKLEAEHQLPILRVMRSNRISAEEADAFLMARNAKDGNALIRARNPENPDVTRYGMTDEEAQSILDAVKADPRAAAFEELGNRFDALNAKTLATHVATGRMTAEQVAALQKAQPHYAPARTDMSGPDGEPVQVPSGKKRVGKPFKKALGRESLAEHPMAFAFAQAEQAITQGQINNTRRAFLNMVRAYQEELGDAIKIVGTPMQRVLVNGEVRESFDPFFRGRNDVVVAWEKGKPVAMEIAPEHADLARAMNQLGPTQLEGMGKLASAFNRMRSALITRYRPFFWPFNMIRDVKSAAYLGSEFGTRFAARVVGDVPRAALTLSGKQTELTPLVARYQDAGGPISFLDHSDLSTQLDKMQAALEEPGTSTGDKTLAGFRAIKSAMEKTSDIGENATRFSAFVHLVEDLGWSDARAAAYAKELQNFERKGLSGNAVNAWYMFANAGVQATRRFAQAMRHPAIRRMVALSFASAMGWDQLQRAIGGQADDGEDWWDKIPDYEKQGNFIFMYPDGSGRRVTIPAPFVFGAVNYTGQQLAALLSGNIKPGKFVTSSTEAWVNALNPLGSISGSDGQGVFRALTPDIARLPLEIATNRDWRGKAIYPESYGSKAPDSARSFPDTNPLAKAAAEWLNRVTGGDQYEPGMFDVAPETLEHVAYFFGAGLPQDVLNVGQQALKLQRGESIPGRDIPLLKRIIREPSPFASWSEQEDLLYTLHAEEKRAEAEKRLLPKSTRAVIEIGEGVERARSQVKKPKKGSGKVPLDEMPEAERQRELQRLDLEAQRWNKRAREELRKLGQ